MLLRAIFSLLIFVFSCEAGFAQRLITGRVMDLNTKSKLEQVDIAIYKGTSITTTNKNGYFQLTVEPNDTLLLMHPAYKVGKIAIPDTDVFLVYLEKVDNYPIYLQGKMKLYTYLEQNLKFSPKMKSRKNEGVLLVQVSVTENGKIDACRLLNEFIEKYEKNALDVFQNIPGGWSHSPEPKNLIFPLIYKFRTSSSPIEWPRIVLPEAKLMEVITIYAEDF